MALIISISRIVQVKELASSWVSTSGSTAKEKVRVPLPILVLHQIVIDPW